MHIVDALMAACREGSQAVAPHLADDFVFEAGETRMGRDAFLRFVDDMRRHGRCLEADGVADAGGRWTGRIRTEEGGPIAATWRIEGERVSALELDALPGALEHLLPGPVHEAVAQRAGALASADAPMRKMDPSNTGARVEAIKRQQDEQGRLQRSSRPLQVAYDDPLDVQSEQPRGPAHEGGWSRDQGAEQSGSSLDEEPNTRADGTITQGGYDGGRRADPPAKKDDKTAKDSHRSSGRSRS